jgi:hypothetical protein
MPTEKEEWKLSEQASEELHAFALCEARDTWRRVQEGGFVEGIEFVFRFSAPIECAGFDSDAKEILIAGADTLFRVELEPAPRVRSRLDLRPFAALFVGNVPARKRPRPDALNALLYRYGTLAAAANAPVDEIAKLNVASSFDEPRLVGRERARRLADVARSVG